MFGREGNEHDLDAGEQSGGHGGCEFGLCQREAELEVRLGTDVVPLLVCGLHVAPVLTWGVPDPFAEPEILVLHWPESAT
jgi:hypothetical protein